MSESINTPRTPSSQAAWREAAKKRALAVGSHKLSEDQKALVKGREAARATAAAKRAGDSGFYNDNITTATFIAEIDGQEIGRFTEISGLEVEVEVDKLEEGGVNGFTHQFPGRMSWPNIVLKRGITETDNLLDWLKKSSGDGFTGQKNKLTRSTFAITLVSATGERLRAWNFEGAFPVKWTGPQFATSQDELPEEELEIAHHGFQVEKKK